MIAALGFLFQESPVYHFFFGGFNTNSIGIYQYQEAETFLPALTANVLGFAAAVEGYNIVNGWAPIDETLDSKTAIAGLRDNYEAGNLKVSPS